MPTASPPDHPTDGKPLPLKPVMPRDSDCCRNDCPNCVFTLYERELERWEQAVAELRTARQQRDAD